MKSIVCLWHGVGSLLSWCIGYATILYILGVQYCKKAMIGVDFILWFMSKKISRGEKELEATPLASPTPSPPPPNVSR